MLNSPDLRSTGTLVLEVETLDSKVDQLQPIVERVKGFVSEELETHMVDGKPIKTKFVLTEKTSVCEWEGPTNMDKQEFSPDHGRDKLKYHVTTLVWRLKFPDMPGAVVPHLRRAPRIDPRSPSTPDEVATRPPLAAQDRSRSLAQRHLRNSHRTHVVPGVRSDPQIAMFRRSGVPPANHRQRYWQAIFRSLRQSEQDVKRNASQSAQAAEEDRRWDCESAMGELEVKEWQAKWEREGPWLRFAE